VATKHKDLAPLFFARHRQSFWLLGPRDLIPICYNSGRDSERGYGDLRDLVVGVTRSGVGCDRRQDRDWLSSVRATNRVFYETKKVKFRFKLLLLCPRCGNNFTH
jgi:hypothetical protein